MGKINGTAVLAYADGTLIAAQRGFTFGINQSPIPTTNKESAGWEEHDNGMRSAELSIDALASTTGLSAKELFDYIITRRTLMLTIVGFDYLWVMEASIPNSSLSAPQEDAVAISGTFKVNGKPYYLDASNPNLLSDPDGVDNQYDTMTVSGISITSAINLAGNAEVASNVIAADTSLTYKCILYLTVTSGELPYLDFVETGTGSSSNITQLVPGINVVTIKPTVTDDLSLRFANTAAANWSTSNIYLFLA